MLKGWGTRIIGLLGLRGALGERDAMDTRACDRGRGSSTRKRGEVVNCLDLVLRVNYTFDVRHYMLRWGTKEGQPKIRIPGKEIWISGYVFKLSVKQNTYGGLPNVSAQMFTR